MVIRREYYERNNHLICSYLYIDRLLDSSLPHNLIQEYNQPAKNGVAVEASRAEQSVEERNNEEPAQDGGHAAGAKVKRTPKDIYKVPNEGTALLADGKGPRAIELAEEDDAESGSPIVAVAIYINLAANAVLL